MDVKWGQSRDMVVRPCRFGQKDRLELVGFDKEAACGVLHWPDVWMVAMGKEQAKKLGFALIKVANSLE